MKRYLKNTFFNLVNRNFFDKEKVNKDSILQTIDKKYNQQTIAVMQRSLNDHSNCIDVGCHIGSVLQEMLKISPNGIHFAFEPIPEFYEKLVILFETYKNVKIYSVALSDSAEASSFQHVISNPGYSGLRRRRYDRDNEEIMEIVVKTNLLDNIIPNNISIDFIKIDVEGAELQVLRGAIETIKKNKPIIVFEHGSGGADYYGTIPEDIYDLLIQCGLKISIMENWLNNGNPLSRQEFVDQFRQGLNYYFMAYP